MRRAEYIPPSDTAASQPSVGYFLLSQSPGCCLSEQSCSEMPVVSAGYGTPCVAQQPAASITITIYIQWLPGIRLLLQLVSPVSFSSIAFSDRQHGYWFTALLQPPLCFSIQSQLGLNNRKRMLNECSQTYHKILVDMLCLQRQMKC